MSETNLSFAITRQMRSPDVGSNDSPMSGSSLERPTSDEGTSAVFFADLTDAQFLDQMAEQEVQARHLAFENEVFFHYLEENDPIGYQEAIAMIEQAMFLKFGDMEEVREATKVRSSRVSLASIFSLLDGRGPRVNLGQKSDMVLRAIEEKQAALDVFVKRSHRTRRKLLSEMEEFQIREGDIMTARSIFEYHIVIEGVDSLTQRIPAEKFLKYMDDWLKSAGLDIEKLRLRTAYMKQQYKKVSTTLERRNELRENLHAVDFDKLEIENKNFSKQLDFKTVNMIQLKTMSADSNRVLSYQKKYVMESQLEGEIYRKQIKELEQSSKSIENECDIVKTAMLHAQKAYEDFLFISDNFRVPDVMEYVNLKKDHADVVKQIKIWQRKKKVLDISLRAAIREMMNHTGCKKIDPSWFQDIDEHSLADSFHLSYHFGESVSKDASQLPQKKEGSKRSSRRYISSGKDEKDALLKHKDLKSLEHGGRTAQPSRMSERSLDISNRISWAAIQG